MTPALPDAVTALPVMGIADDVAVALTTGDVSLRAEPGAGKSTGLPLALLLGGTIAGDVLLLEPRRLAARLVAARLAAHLGEAVGGRIGLRMRADTRVSARTRLTVVTEGVLTRLLQDDPELTGVGLVIFDEFHERSLHADVGLALCLEVRQALREDLRLLLMSATLDAAPLSALLRDVTHFDCPVRQHPVEVRWSGERADAPLEARVHRAVAAALDELDGDVLVFLPGTAEIARCARALGSRPRDGVEVHALHAGVGADAQRAATAPATPGRRRVILSTSLAETSITIDGVRAVVDSGLERRGAIDAVTGAQRLETVPASRASAVQRAGRAGRTAPGVCLRLWNESGHARRAEHWQPEIHRADLAPLTLELGLWGSDPNDLAWPDPPPPASLARARDLLARLGLWRDGRPTAAGRRAAALPVHPRLARMLLWGAENGAGKLACRVAALLDETGRRSGGVDLQPLLNARPSAAVARRARQLEALLSLRETGPASVSADVLLAQAYPDRIARRRPGDTPTYLLACGAGVVLPDGDDLARDEWLVAAELGGAGRQLRVFGALALDVDALRRHAPERFDTVRHVDWDDARERVIAERRETLGHIVVEARPLEDITPDDRAASVLAGIRRRGAACLPWDAACREWQARVERMRELDADGPCAPWPAVDDESLIGSLDAWLLPWLDGIASLRALERLDLHRALDGLLDHRQRRRLEEWLPARHEVPSGSRIALSYARPGPPVLSVRLQEMFGCTRHPTVAGGRVALKVELLSPAHRPVQVTTDLAGFWAGSYSEVRKEMAGRYPKHAWPDDPANARPTARARRRTRPG